MHALALIPGLAGSAELLNVEEPPSEPGSLLVEMACVGICGTDREILEGQYGAAPANSRHLILGHESLGRVVEAPSGSGFSVGDLVVAMVRHPDPVPCPNCAIGEWDMCRNGLYLEHGIKGLHGFACDRYRLDPRRAVRVDPKLGETGVLLEPASILAKAFEHIERIGERARFRPANALILGAGPVGLLGTLMSRQRELETWVLDRETAGLKPRLVGKLGAHFITDLRELGNRAFDVVLECTGVATLIIEAMQRIGPGGVACLTGVSSGGRLIQLDAGCLNREIVLENGAIFGSVNANRRHYEKAAAALAAADRHWLAEMITARVALPAWRSALERKEHAVKNILTGPGYAALTRAAKGA